MHIAFAEPSLPSGGTLIVTVGQDRTLGPAGREIDQITGGAVGRAMAASRFAGKKDEVLELLAPAGLAVARLLLIGLGKPDSLTEASFEAVGGTAVAFLNKTGETEAWLRLDGPSDPSLPPTAAAAAALGAQLRGYRFDRYRTTEKPEQKPSLTRLTLQVPDPAAAGRAFANAGPVLAGVTLARDLISEPANRLTPVTFADRCVALAEFGLEVTVLDEARMAELAMGALLGVAQGSAQPPRLVTLSWRGHPEPEARPVVLVGKGVTFDSGGISIKPAGGMEDMKWDMAGAAVVAGVMRVLAGRKARANVVGVLGLVENMPSGTAQRPGDVVASASGKTIEVINTDAEGRLVLADALWYAQETFKPRLLIDLATLTGAVIIALGHEHAGLFATEDGLAEQLLAAGRKVGEPLWRLPMGESYDKDLNSDIADVKNVGSGRAGGSILGAQFLKRFVGDLPWAHLDIAGVAWAKKDSATVPKGGTGFGVRLLDRFLAETAEG
jgi:leucyl aminopeptidase